MHSVAVTHSIPDAVAVGESIAGQYDIGGVIDCRLHMSGVNDVLFVDAGSGRFVFKLYRHLWRSESNLRFEMELLAHLHRKECRVARPVLRQGGEVLYPLQQPEGERFGILFEYAPGKPPTWPFYEDEVESRLLGATLADLHNAAADFDCRYTRPAWDILHLLDEPLATIEPFLAHRPDDGIRLREAVVGMRAELDALVARGLSWGVCHGDYQCGNMFLDGDTVVVFDFDVCGFGWLAFDLARWRENTHGDKGEASWQAFIAGYESRCARTDADRDAIPLFCRLRALHWARVKLDFVARRQWDGWDTDFFLSDLLARLEAP